MQKKNKVDPQESAWQDSLKKDQRNQNLKKYAVWAVFGLIFLAGLGVLVKMSENTSTTSTPIEVASLPEITEKDIVIGDKNAKVAVIEYADFQCPACASYNSILNKLENDYKGKVKFVYRLFPLTGAHKNALISGQAAYAANKQGKFSEMKNLLYDNQTSWENLEDPRDTFIVYAQRGGLDVERFKADMNSDEAKKEVLAAEKSAISLGINSTPTFFIGNKSVSPQGYEEFKSYIDQELANK